MLKKSSLNAFITIFRLTIQNKIDIMRDVFNGGMVEWLKAPVLKTGEGLRPP
ncbi:hypothetical protein HD_0722 [[Haemophilus] ducreyi 35000HP]|uniref:Uncharacterized protein n=1 Tax=Haemophilus ducreyi (strain 35000HP / ATCC 700724) TaxID=233412 RepID=Q7VN58_HAEDU|nr:hypothetical protein HD_0722 [[Haemophilus] ducreyi 35000HP]